MTCRFEEEFAGRQYPRSCPTCGISGACPRGYEQVKLTPEQAERLGFHYVIVDPKGKPEPGKQAKWNSAGSGIPSQVLIAMTNKRAGKEPLVPAPEGVLSVHPGEPGHETYVPRPKAYEYGPVNCNVARVRNAAQRPDTCERCGYSNEQGCSSASLAEHCLFYRHQPGFGFMSKIGATEREIDQTPSHLVGYVPPQPKPASVGTKLTRVKRAQIKDLVDQYRIDFGIYDLHKNSPANEAALDKLIDDLINIINKT
jgi:hypothetical protein